MRLRNVVRRAVCGLAIAGLIMSAAPSFAQLSPSQLKAQKDRAAREAATRAEAERQRAIVAAAAAAKQRAALAEKQKKASALLAMRWEAVRDGRYGAIFGQFGYPSDYIPGDMKACAVDISTGNLFCADIINFRNNQPNDFIIFAPPGVYFVYSYTKNNGNEKVYYSEFVKCGYKFDCNNHDPIKIKLEGGSKIYAIDPIDYYNK